MMPEESTDRQGWQHLHIHSKKSWMWWNRDRTVQFLGNESIREVNRLANRNALAIAIQRRETG